LSQRRECGFYLGLNAGGGIGNGRSDFSIAGGPAFATVNNSLPGAIGGVQAGFNWQSGMTVFGVETDFQASGLKGSLTAPCLALCGLPLTATYSQKVPWFGTVRGRLGVAASGWLIYATAGYAYARLEADKVGVTVERIVKELERIAFADIRNVVVWHGLLVTEEDNPDGGDVLVIKHIFSNHVFLKDSNEISEDVAVGAPRRLWSCS